MLIVLAVTVSNYGSQSGFPVEPAVFGPPIFSIGPPGLFHARA
jgi:hypothetical protein